MNAEVATPAETESAEPAADAPDYGFLFEATEQPVPVADLPPEPESPAELSASGTEEADSDASSRPVQVDTRRPDETAGWLTMAPPEPPSPDEQPTSEPPGLIDAVPWDRPDDAPIRRAANPQRAETPTMAPRLSLVSEPAATTPPITEVEQTVDRSKLLAPGAPAPGSGPTVLAGHCPFGHLSPPYAATCRICHAEMPSGQQGFEIPRPSLGVLRLETGATVNLDRGVLLGRAPELPADLADRPHLVRLVSPENDVSRNHAEIVIDGWHVYARDLGSTNGTTVTLPGQSPVRLRPDDLQLLDPGSLVTLADEITLTFEVTA